MKKIVLALVALVFLAGCMNQSPKIETDLIPMVQPDISQETTLTSIKQKKIADVTTRLDVNLTESRVEWRGGKILGGDHWGEIKLKSATLDASDGKIMSGTVVIDMNSMMVSDLAGAGAQKLIDHFMNEDFFAVEEYPESTMRFDQVVYESESQASASGDLIIKGITKPVNFVFNVEGNKATAELLLDRTEWDIRYGSGKFFEDLGDKAIKDEMKIKITLVTNNIIDSDNISSVQ